MTLAAWTWHGGSAIGAVIAFLIGALLAWFFGRRGGKTQEEVLRRVVETSHDESTRIKTLADEHAMALKSRDDSILKIRGDQEAELLALRADRDKALLVVKEREAELTTHKTEATKLQGLVGTVDTSKKEIDDLKVQLTKQKADYEGAVVDLRKRVETVEAAKIAAEKRSGDLEASHVVALGEWRSKVTAAESKSTEVQGLLGSAKADNDKILAEWRLRAEKAEAGQADSAKRLADFDLRVKTLESDHAKVVGDWQGRVKDAESKSTEVQGLLGSAKADNDKVLLEWRLRAEKAEAEHAAAVKRSGDLEASHVVALGEWRSKVTAAESKSTEVQGLLGSAKADNDKMLAEWRLRAEKAEGDLGNWSRRYADLEATSKTSSTENERLLGDWRKRAETAEASVADSSRRNADWEARYKALEADRAQVATDWDLRLKASDAALVARNNEVHGLISSAKADHDSAIAGWSARFAALQQEHSSCAAREAEVLSLRSSLAEVNVGPDDLLVIEGIGPKINQALRADGYTRWVQVRDASQEQLRSAIEKGGITFAPSMATWSKQAAYLAAGDQAGFKQYTDYLVSGQDPSSFGGEVVSSDTGHAQSSLAGSAGSISTGVGVATTASTSDGSDDLQTIEGIGPKFNQALNNAGLKTFAQVAASSEATLRAAIQTAGLNFAPSIVTWAQQARLLADGDQAGFDALVARLVAGRNEV